MVQKRAGDKARPNFSGKRGYKEEAPELNPVRDQTK